MKDKKNMAMIIVIGIALILFLCVNSTAFATTGTVTGSNLRVRKEESTTSEIIDLLDENDKVEILSESEEWYKIKVNGKVGYVNKKFIKVQEGNTINNETVLENNQNASQDEEAKTEQTSEGNQAEQSTQPEESVTNVQEEQPKKVKLSADVELRVMPLINGTTINVASASETYDVISTAGLWSYVKSGEKEGWVLTEKSTNITAENTQQTQNETSTQESETKTEESKPEVSSTEKLYSKSKTYYVKGTSVNARSAASKTASVVKVLNTNNTVKVIGEDESWYIAEINGERAYIAKSLLSTEKVEVTSRSSNSVTEASNQNSEAEETRSSVPSNPIGENVVAYAKTFLGYSYVYGTNGPNTFDCSGFVQYVYKHFGYSLSRSSSTQANDGVAVSKSDLQPGDVLIFRDTSNSRIGHVGLYIGGGQFIHASNSKTGVIISSLDTSAYQKRYVGARRIL